MAAKVGTALEVGSSLAITVGAALVSTALGFIVAGVFAGIVIAIALVLAINVVGDGLRDLADPKQRK